MKYNINFIERYLTKVESEQDYYSKLTWLKEGEPSQYTGQVDEWISKLDKSKAVFDKAVKVKEYLKTKGYTNQERLCEFPYLIDLLYKCYNAGYSVGENEVYQSMNLRPPNDTFHDDFKGYMNIAWDVRDELLKQLYKEEINKL